MFRKWLPPWISAAAAVLVIWLSGIVPAQKPTLQESPALQDNTAPATDGQENASVETPLATLDWLLGSWSGGTETGKIEFS